MTSRTLALFALALCLPLPFVAAAPGPDADGVVPVGTGGAHVLGVDHQRHRVPDGVVGLVLLREVTTQASSAPCADCAPRYAVLAPCPEGMACTMELRPTCLVVHAAPGALGVRYAFAWTTDPAEATVLLEHLPRLAPMDTSACA